MSSQFPCVGRNAGRAPTRRDFLYGLGSSLGSVALTALLSREASAADAPPAPLGAKPAQLQAKAMNCIFLMMEGGPSHIDTFDPKPKLAQLHLQEFHRDDKMQSAMSGGKRYYVKSPFEFHKVGQCGADMAVSV